jgi:CpeT/CpcT family protein DUF1001
LSVGIASETSLVKRSALLAAALSLVACGPAESPGSTASGTTSASASSSGVGGAGGGGNSGGSGGTGGAASPELDAVEADLLGDFDNAAQHAMGLIELVERHVCTVPGRAESAQVLWLYAEELDDTSGKRNTTSSRVNEIRIVDGKPVIRIYKLAPTHPLAEDPYKLDGARDGCSKPEVLQAITDADLLYRDGCDLTLLSGEGVFQASTEPNTCAVPGGFVNTEAVVSPDGLARTESFHDSTSMKSQPLSTLDFLRVEPAP